MPIALLIRRVTFSAAHRLHCNDLSDRENLEIFGKCDNLNGHGHNYALEVTVRGAISPRTGMVMNLSDLSEVIDVEVIKQLDHKHLNLDVPAFHETNPTAENIAVFIWKALQKKLPRGFLQEVKLRETENNVVIYRGEGSGP